MTKKISTFIFIGLIATIIVWMADKTSLVTIDWRGSQNQLSIPEAMIIVLLLVALLDLVTRLFHKLIGKQIKEAYCASALNTSSNESAAIDVLAGKISEKIVLDRKDFDKSLLLVLKSMTAITAGDMKEARHCLAALKKLIGHDPIIDVLKIKIYKGEKDYDKMEKLSAKIIKNEDTQIIGMKAAIEAQMQKKEFSEALNTANKAFELRQDLYWVIENAFELRAKNKDWEGAMQVLEAGIKKKLIPADKYKRLKSIVLFEMSKEAQVKGDDVNFFRLCNQAIEADQTLVPAAIAMSKFYVANDNQFRKAAKVLTMAWKKNPVDDIAYEYLNLWANEDIRTRIQRMETFALLNGLRPSLNNRLLAELSAQANLWGKAKAEVEIFLINNPCTRKICRLIAKYELVHNKDKIAAKKWDDKYETCAEDSEWICESCGALSETWHAVCPVCGAFGQDRWHLYVEGFEQNIDEHDNDFDDEED